MADGPAARCCGPWCRGRSPRTGGRPGLRRAGWHRGAVVSHRVGTPMAPALAVVCGHAEARLVAQVPVLAHAARGRPRTAVAPSLRGVGLLARPFARPQLSRGHLLPHFPRGALCQGRPAHPPPLRSALGPTSVLPLPVPGTPSVPPPSPVLPTWFQQPLHV